MHKGGKFQTAVAMLALAGCNAESGKLTIRSMPAPVSSVAKPVPLRVAEARGHLALGNVALALESYRKAVREQPDNIEALAGVAGCYDRMGRFDLSRRNYEAALALAPRDTTLLAAFAASLDLQGRSDEAAGVRREIRVAAASFTPPMAPVPLKIAAPVTAAPPVSIVAPAPKPTAVAAAPLALALAEAAAPILPAAPGRPAARPAAPAAPEPVKAAPAPAPKPATAPSVTVALPAPKPAALPPTPVTAPAAVAAEAPAAPASEPSAEAQQSPPATPPAITPPVDRAPVAAPAGPFREPPVRSVAVEPQLPSGTAPRLERMSLGEVALVTSGRPQWRAQTVQRSDRSTTIRFVPLRTASARANAVRTASMRTGGVRLLNAARYKGLAANTRSYLAVRGWRRIEIGDAPQVRQTSLILYPPSRRVTAKRLAAQFGFAIASRPEGTELVMLIGRDATRSRRHASG